MNSRAEVIRNSLITVVGVVVILGAVWLGTAYGRIGLFAVVGVIGLVVGIYVGLRHPLWYFWGLAAIMAGLAFGRIPGISLPIYLPLAFGAIVAAFFHPRFATSMHPLEVGVLVLFLGSGVAMAIASLTLPDVSLYVRWGIATLVMLALARLAPSDLARFGRIFAVVAAVNGAYGIFLLFLDPGNKTLGIFKVFGYLPQYTTAFVAYAGDAAPTSRRLGGTWVEPNGAGLNLALALALTALLFTGWRRVVLALVITAALVLTLSRASMFTIVAGVLLLIVFHPMAARARVSLIALLTAAAVTALAFEPVRRRLLTSFGAGDTGADARVDALRVFPERMSGHWFAGVGWARREFIDPAYSFVFNFPSNAPLVTLYRGGLLAFLPFMAVVVIGCVLAYRAVRQQSFPLAAFGAVFIGLCVVQMQLDHPLAGTPQGALTYSIYLAFLVYVDRLRRQRNTQAAQATSAGFGSSPGDFALTR